MASVLDRRIFQFTATVERPPGKGAWYFIEFPHDVKELFGTRGAVRVKGTIDRLEIDRALMPTKSGFHVIALSKEMRKALKVHEGDKVQVHIWRNEEPDDLELPEELVQTMELIPELEAAWASISIGRRRGICHWINSGRTVETRAKRVAEVLKRSEEGHAWFKPGRKRED